MNDASRFLSDVRDAIVASGMPHMIVGSTVVNWIGPPRTTNDVDIVIEPTRDQLMVLIHRLVEAGMYIDELTAIEALSLRSMVNAIDADTGWKADFIVLRDDAFSRQAFSRRLEHLTPVGALSIQTPEDLILSKLSWRKESQSERQMRDVVGVFDIWRSKLDATYLRKWAVVLDVAAEVEELYCRPE